MLFDTFEVQLELSPAAIPHGDGSRRQFGVVHQEGQRLALVFLDANLVQRRLQKYGRAQVDGRGVQRIHDAGQVDPKGLIGVKFSRNADQVLRKVGIDAPAANRVDVGYRAPCYRSPEAYVIQLDRLTAQTGFDVSQARQISQLREGRLQILVETSKVRDLVFPS